MKNNIKYIIGGVLLVALIFSYGFISKAKNNKIQDDLLAMNIYQNDVPEFSLQKPKAENTIEFRINKNTTDAEFLRIMEELKKKDIDVMFNNVERNEDGIITNIEITVSKQDLNEDFSDNNPNGIQPILIKIADNNIFVGYEFQNQDDFFAFSGGNEADEMAQIQKMMQRQMQMLRQMHGSSNNNNDIFAQFFGNDMTNPDEMMQKMMQQFMQNDAVLFSNNHSRGNTNSPKAKTEVKIEKHYIVNGKEMSEEEYQKMDKSKIRSLQVYQTQVVSKRYGM